MEVLSKVAPIIIILLIGHILKRHDILKKEDGDLLLKLVFNVGLPSLILVSLSTVPLQADLLYLPLSAVVIVLISSAVAYFVATALKLNRPSFGTFVISASILNIGFSLPFLISSFGQEVIARVALFDVGNGILTFTYVYYLASYFGNSLERKMLTRKIVASPPLWAIAIALTLNVTGTSLPGIFHHTFQVLSALTVPLILLSLGVYVRPHLTGKVDVYAATVVRMIGGLLVALVTVHIFELEGLSRIVVLICGAAPAGYNTLTFSSLENLDKESAANIISFSLFLGVIFIPILLLLLR